MALAALQVPRLRDSADALAGANHELELLTYTPDLHGSSFVFGRKQEIFGEGEEARAVYCVMTGAVRSYKMLTDGRRQVSAFHLVGDLFGLAAGPLYDQSAEAMIETKVMVFSRRQLEACAQHDVNLAYDLWAAALRQLEHMRDHVLLLGRRSALERVAAFLAEIERSSGGSESFVLPMTRRDIADYLGLTIETVSRVLTQLEAEGALIRVGARRIRLRHTVLREILCD